MTDIITKLDELNQVSNDSWVVVLHSGGSGFLRNRNRKESDRYFVDLTELRDFLYKARRKEKYKIKKDKP